ncbi:hypothetical protein CEUSTIGMA_g6270.t1 [Chlamydomonas eustigma]|uniref:Large ribosomal subunit protein uL3c n=1 Tax=Chlamydomonas eustigma TaxID=1157962 RepID=A0A250X6W7_9CHLO|nr:hypothetical protein CEUSTIGMA_g6270.t1 [Chlamydomonas eustigma]|eukprot:GAX78833.1 hypothetical protein CEUSTIGMA_g6270.t1 [Chlamydomonas eustigma]
MLQKLGLRSTGTFCSGAAPLRRVAMIKSSRGALRVEARSYAAGVGLFATKAGMMSFFTADGLCVPATVVALEAGNVVTMVKTDETDGYNAVQTGYKIVAERKVKKPELGHLKKAGCEPMKHLREWKLKDKKTVSSFTPGQKLEVTEMFKEGDFIDIAGITIGKGFQGTVKRWGHKRGAMTHGSKSHREHGSIGASTTPGRVFPGLKMAGHMGAERRTAKHNQILKIDAARKAIVVKGSLPGKTGTVLELSPAKLVGTNC